MSQAPLRLESLRDDAIWHGGASRRCLLKNTHASSSIGRAAVSKTAGWGFDSLLACHFRSGTREDMDKLKIALAFACIALGVFGYYYFSETAMVLRILMVLAGRVAAAGVAWLSAPGKEFFAFA